MPDEAANPFLSSRAIEARRAAPSPRGVVLACLVFLGAACFYHRALAAPPAAADGSYSVIRIEPLSSGGVTKFRHTLATRRPTIQHNSPVDAFEVDLRSGLFVLRQTDLFVKDTMPLCLTRTYRPWDKQVRALGMGTSHPYEVSESGSRYPYTYIDIILEDYETVHFNRVSPGSGFADAVYIHSTTASEFYGAQVSWNGNGWTLGFRDGRVLLLPEAYNAKTPTQAAVVEMRNAQGQRIRFDRESGTGNLRRLTSPSGHTITFAYIGNGQVDSATDDLGNEVDYYYDSEKRLYAASRSNGHAYRFAYNRDMITTISDEKRRVLLEIGYDEYGRVEEERVADGGVYSYRYTQNQKGEVRQVFVTGPDGTMYAFDHGTLVSKK
jgi:YD repeat-containing protein